MVFERFTFFLVLLHTKIRMMVSINLHYREMWEHLQKLSTTNWPSTQAKHDTAPRKERC